MYLNRKKGLVSKLPKIRKWKCRLDLDYIFSGDVGGVSCMVHLDMLFRWGGRGTTRGSDRGEVTWVFDSTMPHWNECCWSNSWTALEIDSLWVSENMKAGSSSDLGHLGLFFWGLQYCRGWKMIPMDIGNVKSSMKYYWNTRSLPGGFNYLLFSAL